MCQYLSHLQRIWGFEKHVQQSSPLPGKLNSQRETITFLFAEQFLGKKKFKVGKIIGPVTLCSWQIQDLYFCIEIVQDGCLSCAKLMVGKDGAVLYTHDFRKYVIFFLRSSITVRKCNNQEKADLNIVLINVAKELRVS